MQSEQVNELSAGLAKAQGSMKAAVYNRINPHFKSHYADLAAVWDAIRAPLSTNGLSVTQTLEPINGVGFYLRTTLYHISGQWISSMYPLPAEVTPQQLGSALTYARRYSLSSIVGIAADEDDDANEAQKVKPQKIPLKQQMNDEIPDFADAASSVEGAAAVAPSPATGGADLKLQLLYSVARAEAMKGEAAINAWFKTRSREEKEELRKIKTELVALYPK